MDLWPAPVSEDHANTGAWTQIGGDNVVAVGTDCPYVAHGPTDSLEVCQSACANNGACNVINWNPDIPDCVYRQCVDPMHPQLSPGPGYTVYATTRPSYTLSPRTWKFRATGFSNDVLVSAMTRYSSMAFLYGNTSAGTGTVIPGLNIKVLSSDSDLRLGIDESYTLVIPDPATPDGSGTLTAQTVFGALWGLETFSQLVQFNFSENAYTMSYTNVTDYPRFPWRGVMVDTSRHFMALPTLRIVVDAMSYLKLNTLHLHLTDDQSWPLVLNSAPRLALTGAYSNVSHTYSAADMKALVNYARLRGVRVVPEFDTPAHFSPLFNAYPEYAAVAYDNQNNSFLCLVDPSKEETFTFLTNVWAEIISIFPDAYVHIGGDEFWDCWDSSPTVSKWMASQGFDVTAAYYYYERRVIDIIRAHNRSTLAWLDIAGFPANFSGNYSAYPDVTLDVWSGCYSGDWQDDTATFTSQNMSVIVSGPFYITQQNGAPDTPHFTWEQMYATDLWNFTGGNTTQAQALVRGGELCAWDDAAQTDSGDLLVSLTPYLLGVAEAWWSPQSATSGVSPDESRAHSHRCRMVNRGLPGHPVFAFSSYCLYEYSQPLPAWEAGL